MSSLERTMQLVRNLDREAIEAKLVEARREAQAAGLMDLAKMFIEVEGAPRALLEQRVRSAIQWLNDKPEHARLSMLLQLVDLNLPNLK